MLTRFILPPLGETHSLGYKGRVIEFHSEARVEGMLFMTRAGSVCRMDSVRSH